MKINERLVMLETEMRYIRKIQWVIVTILLAQLGVSLV